MCGVRDESIVLETIVDAAERLIELGGQAPHRMLGLDRELNERIMLSLIVLGEAAKRLSPALTRDLVRAEFDAASDQPS